MVAKRKLQKNGEDVTAQQAYDAFMNGVVLIDGGNGKVALVTGIQWCDSNGGQDDPNNVMGIRLLIDGQPLVDVGNVRADW